jgi:hypothetical protein
VVQAVVVLLLMLVLLVVVLAIHQVQVHHKETTVVQDLRLQLTGGLAAVAVLAQQVMLHSMVAAVLAALDQRQALRVHQ